MRRDTDGAAGTGEARGFWSWAQWLLLPLALLAVAEGCARRSVDHVPRWYGAAEALAAQGPISALFIGSSRVEAAVAPLEFEDEAARLGGLRGRALNLGRGYSTDAMHWFGVRNLLLEHPHNLRGVAVFVEVPGGLPFTSSWRTSPWARAEQPWMLAEVLRRRDLAGVWRSSGLDFETRLHLLARFTLRPLSLLRRRERVRETALEAAAALSQGRRPRWPVAPPLGADLAGPGVGSIRTDNEAVQAARRLAQEFARQMRGWEGRPQAPMRGFQHTVLASLVALVNAHGGQVVFFVPPQGEVFLATYRTPLRSEDRRLFAEQARAWNALLLDPEFPYDDSDLPDLWHLRPERAPEFSRALARAWVAARAAPRP